MNRWKDIYDLSDRIVRYIFRNRENEEEEKREHDDMELELVMGRLIAGESFSKRIKLQEKYNGLQAYQKWVKHRRMQTFRRCGISVAAAVIIAVGVWYGFLGLEEKSEMEFVVEVVKPGTKKAVLTLADGTIWNIRDSAMIIGGNELGWSVDSGRLYVTATDSLCSDSKYNTLMVPRGGEFYLILSDGTEVWLNSESVLRFPVCFVAGKREVELEGEAYFDVAHDEMKPFCVMTRWGKVSVLGTEFCLSAYPEENLAATLVNGSIGLETYKGEKCLLKPNQQAVYDVQNGRLDVLEVDPWVYTSWREKVFCFEKQSLENILNVLSRWYNVQIYFETEELKKIKLSGTLDKYSEIESFLRLFEAGTDICFELKGRNMVVRKKK